MSVQTDKLLEILRQQQQVLDEEMRASEEVDSKTETLLSINGGVLGASIILVRVIFGESSFLFSNYGFASYLAASAGYGLTGAATVLLFHGYVGLSSDSEPTWTTGPDPDDLVPYGFHAAITLDNLLMVLMFQYPSYVEDNQAERRRIMDLRRPALYSLFIGLGAFMMATLIWMFTAHLV